jgi:hypothetical protein
MPYNASAGIAIATSAASTTFYQLTDHNRQSISIGFDVLEKAARMADGTMRKYVVARKRKISTAWSELPSGTGKPFNPSTSSAFNTGYTFTVDGNKGGAWIKSFYEQNVFKPVVIKITHSKDSASANSDSSFYPSPSASAVETLSCFITDFKYDIIKRYELTDLVNISIEFTEI